MKTWKYLLEFSEIPAKQHVTARLNCAGAERRELVAIVAPHRAILKRGEIASQDVQVRKRAIRTQVAGHVPAGSSARQKPRGMDNALYSILASAFMLLTDKRLGINVGSVALAMLVIVPALAAGEPRNECAEAQGDRRIAVCSMIVEDTMAGAEVRSRALDNRGIAYAERKEWQRALQDFDEAIRLSPENLTAHLNRASLFVETGSYKAARRRDHLHTDRA